MTAPCAPEVALERSTQPTGYRIISLLLRVTLAWILGIGGVLLGVRGWGGFHLSSEVASRSQAILLAQTIAWTGAWMVFRRSPRHLVLSLLAFTPVLVWAMAPNAGRAPAVIAAAGLTASLLVCTGWPSAAVASPPRLTISALPLLLAAQTIWLRSQPVLPVLLLLLLAGLGGVAADRQDHPVAHLEERLRSSSRSIRAALVPRSSVDRVREHLRRNVPVVAVAIAVAAVWSVAVVRLTREGDEFLMLGINDFPFHLQVAARFSFWPGALEEPHFLFHFITAAFEPVLGARLAPVATIAVSTTASFLALVYVLRVRAPGRARLRRPTATLTSLGYFLAESPTLLLIWTGVLAETTPFLAVHWWGNPTWLIALPFTLLALPMVDEFLSPPATSSPHPARRWLLTAVLVLGLVAKPALGLCLVAAVPMLLLIRRADRATWERAAAWIVVPTAAVVAWQIWFLRTSPRSQFGSGWTFDPVVEPVPGWDGILSPLFWGPFVAIIVLAIWSSRGRFWREPAVDLALLCCGIGLTMMLTLRETGERAQHGNNAVPFQAAVTVLGVLAFRSCVWAVTEWWRSRDGASSTPPAWVVSCFVVAAALLAGGALSLLHGLGVVDVPFGWEATVGS